MIRQIHKLADRHENKGARVFHAALKKQFDSAASFIEKGGNIDGLEIFPTPLRDAMRSYHQMVQMDSAELQYRDLRSNNPVKAGIGTEISTQWLRQIQAWVLVNTGDHITKINDTTLDRIRSIHAAGIADGLGPRDIAKRIRKESGEPFSVYRSTVIARTESTRSASQGHKIGAEAWEKETGQKTYKQWSATNDSRTRDAHRAMLVLHIIPKEDKFQVGGVAMDAPGDPKGGAKNVVNCRCRIYYMSERIARRKLGEQPKPAAASPKVPINIKDYEKHTGVTVDKTIFDSLNQITPLVNKPGGAYFDPNINTVNIPLRITNKWRDESVVYHEYGHAIDWQNGIRKMPEVKALMDKYRKVYSKDNDKLFKQFHTELFNGGYKAYASGDEVSMSQHGAIDDTIMSLNYNYCRGHDQAYFKRAGMSEAEFVAHAFENKFIGNPIFKKFAPDLYEEMIAMIEGILSKLK